MKDLNNAVLVGRFGRDPEAKTTKNGTTYVDFTLANNQGYGENEETEWISCKAWAGTADVICKYCTKGTKVTVVGNLRTYSYMDQETGKNVYRTYISVNELYLPERKSSGSGNENSYSQPQQSEPSSVGQAGSYSNDYSDYGDF